MLFRDIKVADFDAPEDDDEENDDGYEEGRG